ncbi:Glutathionyl-hydroquinone reductase [Seminavis robusta]|uniref:Glutathionyl-hydroquinone reductase n=1 Tax=Seminavis robusta TaxID=568900 RepID=A0A9N8EYH0_9STRA|nr:Glutathionyl-hydroquinone reductase [Seminavis robusta]|eukprot:Sro1979_g309090.1 Glutathionyl-hydroquinone reductase (393) ;mRNA; r:12875-14149
MLLATCSLFPRRAAPFSTSSFVRLGFAAIPVSTRGQSAFSSHAHSLTTTRHFAARSALAEVSNSGEFKRVDAAWRNWISSDEGAKFPPEKDRYHLFVAYACPWAHRTLMTRALKGLEDAISVTVVHPVWQKTKPEVDEHKGWIFGNPSGNSFPNADGKGGPFPPAFPGNEPNPFFDSLSIREVYDKAGDTDGKYSVPVLWDKKENTIVSNESAEIILMLNKEFNAFAKHPDLDLAPTAMEDDMEAVDDWIYPTINNGVYKCGFATSQQAYDAAIEELTASIDRLEEILKKQRYIAGDSFTLSDIRLFVTLVRFDEVYVVYFKTNSQRVMDSPAILNYCREIYQMPGVAETVDMEQIKAHYYCSHPILNAYSIIPKGPDFVKLLEEPHNRDEM